MCSAFPSPHAPRLSLRPSQILSADLHTSCVLQKSDVEVGGMPLCKPLLLQEANERSTSLFLFGQQVSPIPTQHPTEHAGNPPSVGCTVALAAPTGPFQHCHQSCEHLQRQGSNSGILSRALLTSSIVGLSSGFLAQHCLMR